MAFLWDSLSAWVGRGRVFSRRDRVFDALVPDSRLRQSTLVVFDRHAIVQFISPKVSYYMLRIGTDEAIGDSIVHHPIILGLKGWQWMYIGWGARAVILGIHQTFLTDRPGQARWLDTDEREALEAELSREKAQRRAAGGHMRLAEALANPKVLLLTLAYFFVGHWELRSRDFSAKHSQTVVSPERRSLDLGADDSSCWFLVRPALRRLEFRPNEGTPLARRFANSHRRDRSRLVLGSRLAAAADDLSVYLGCAWDESISTRVLEPSEPLSHRSRCRWKHWADQLGGESRRRGRADIAGHSQGMDRIVRPGNCLLTLSIAASGVTILLLGLGKHRDEVKPTAVVEPLAELA